MELHYVKYLGRNKDLKIVKINVDENSCVSEQGSGRVRLRNNKIFDPIHNVEWEIDKGYYPASKYKSSGEARYIAFITNENDIQSFKERCKNYPPLGEAFDFPLVQKEIEKIIVKPVVVEAEIKPKATRKAKTEKIEMPSAQELEAKLKEVREVQAKLADKWKVETVQEMSEDEIQEALMFMKNRGK